MPTDLNNAARLKEMILSTVRSKGPSLPINIARDVKTSTLFASAFLSELYHERKVLMSHLKVGSTSLYLVPGQEELLENFIQYLNRKEQEAFHLIKQAGKLEEDKLHPAIRVAIKEIKDFATPVQENVNGQIKTIWKYAFLKDQTHAEQTPVKEVPITVAASLNPNIPASIQQAVHNQFKSEVKEQSPLVLNNSKQEIIAEPQKALNQIKESIHEIESELKEVKKEKKKQITKVESNLSFSLISVPKIEEPKIEETQFGKEVRKYCNNKQISIVSIEEEKKKDFTAILEVETPLGKHNFYCIAHDKKKINESDIQVALQKAQEKRMPVLLLLSAPLDKKGQLLVSSWQNLIKVDKLKL